MVMNANKGQGNMSQRKSINEEFRAMCLAGEKWKETRQALNDAKMKALAKGMTIQQIEEIIRNATNSSKTSDQPDAKE